METNSVDHSSRPPRRSRMGAGWCLLGILASGCVFDPDKRCGPNETIYGDNLLCVCVEGTVKNDKGCAPCGANEVAQNGACVCVSGYTKPSTGGACQPMSTSGQGVACDAQTAPCTDPTYNHCLVTSGAGYCTNTGCSATAACSGGYACDTSVTPSVCKRPPSGLGKTCSAEAECAGTEATYCDTVMTHSCLVIGCTLGQDSCFQGYECCDLSSYGVAKPLCVVKGNCTK